MRFLSRLLSLFALAGAVVTAVIDATRSIATASITLTPFIESWQASSPGTFEAFRKTVEDRTFAALWDPGLTAVLSLPSWLLFAALALIFYILGQPKRRPDDLFAARY